MQVVDGALPGSRDLRMAVERFRRHSRTGREAGGSESGGSSPAGLGAAGEQTHLFVIYREVVECCRVTHKGVREAASAVLQSVGALLPIGGGLMHV